MNTRDFVSSLTLALALSSGTLYGACNKPDANDKENESIPTRFRYGSRFEAAMRELLPRLGFKLPPKGDESRRPPDQDGERGGTDGPAPASR